MISTKEDLFQTICNASRLGTLGLFIGAGFSKALLEGNTKHIAYRCGELLEASCEKLEIDKQLINTNGAYPELATKICQLYADISGKSYELAAREFKEKICELTDTYPDQEKIKNYGKWFEEISPEWIVTTNYDTIIESVLGGKALSIAPDRCFCNISGMVPVFHLHGICREPDSVVITNEDYTYMFRPNDYRQARLPFLMKESCVLMIGYGLGDINVITAVDWANNVYTNSSEGYDFPIIQLLYVDAPKPAPYISKDNIVIYEINNLEDFFRELSSFMNGYNEKYDEKMKTMGEIVTYLNCTEDEHILDFIDNKDCSKDRILNFFKTLEPEFGYVYNVFFPFVRCVVANLDELSARRGAFQEYDRKLCFILDIFMSIPINKIPASLFGLLAEELNAVAVYVNSNGEYVLGESYSATDSWGRYKNAIPKDVIRELRRLTESSQSGYDNLRKLLYSIDSENIDSDFERAYDIYE